MSTNNNNFFPQIVWEKWIDPFGEDIEETKWNSYDEEHEEDNDLSTQQELFRNKKTIRVIASPMGLIPYNEHTSSAKIFNFWVGHTNFDISKNIANIIENCDGVEILDIFTRYRFRLGVAKCFQDSEVMQNIRSSVCKHFQINDSE